MSDHLAESQSRQEIGWVAARARAAKRRGIRFRCALVIALLVWVAVPDAGHADSQDSMQGLDEQVQEIKSDVLAIAAELRQLEEKLALSVRHSGGGLPVAASKSDPLETRLGRDPDRRRSRLRTTSTSFKELEALRKGGVQRIYTGNLPTGDHRIAKCRSAGTLPGGCEARRESRAFPFARTSSRRIART